MIGQSDQYILANSQAPILKTSPNTQSTIAKQFNLAMPGARVKIAEWVAFCHPTQLDDRPVRFKQG
jgi:hypothetical protein